MTMSEKPTSPRLEDLKKLSLRSKKPLTWYGLAMEYRSLGDVDAALETFKHVHVLDAAYVPAYFMCGQVLAECDRADEARVELAAGLAAARAQGDDHAVGEMQALLDTLDD